MANIVVYTMAYRGDVYPFVPIAAELDRRGHNVTMVTPSEFHEDFAAEGFWCRHSGTDFAPTLLNEPRHARYVRRWGMRFKGAALGRKFFGELTANDLDVLYDTLRLACTDTQADLIVTHRAAAVVSSMVAESLDLPWVTGELFPMLVPSSYYPPPGLVNLGRKANEWAWAMARWPVFEPLTHAGRFTKFRARKGLNADRQNPFRYGDSPYLNIGLSSPHYFRPAPDWPDNHVPAGFSFWDGPNQGALSDEVVDFLAGGPKPVVVCLGTSAASAKPELFEIIRSHLTKLGERGLYLTSVPEIAQSMNSAIRAESTSDEQPMHLAVDFAPLSAVISQAKAVVQSGILRVRTGYKR